MEHQQQPIANKITANHIEPPHTHIAPRPHTLSRPCMRHWQGTFACLSCDKIAPSCKDLLRYHGTISSYISAPPHISSSRLIVHHIKPGMSVGHPVVEMIGFLRSLGALLVASQTIPPFVAYLAPIGCDSLSPMHDICTFAESCFLFR